MLKENEGQEQNCVGLTVQPEAVHERLVMLACPFCGSAAKNVTEDICGQIITWTQCTGCGASATIEAWKKRAT